MVIPVRGRDHVSNLHKILWTQITELDGRLLPTPTLSSVHYLLFFTGPSCELFQFYKGYRLLCLHMSKALRWAVSSYLPLTITHRNSFITDRKKKRTKKQKKEKKISKWFVRKKKKRNNTYPICVRRKEKKINFKTIVIVYEEAKNKINKWMSNQPSLVKINT